MMYMEFMGCILLRYDIGMVKMKVDGILNVCWLKIVLEIRSFLSIVFFSGYFILNLVIIVELI